MRTRVDSAAPTPRHGAGQRARLARACRAMNPWIHVQGKVALATGGSRGIGEAIARALGQSGAQVAIASRKLEGVAAAAARLREAGVSVEPFACHTGKTDQIDALVAAVVARFGKIDV